MADAGSPDPAGWLRAADLARLRAEGRAVFTGGDRPVVLFYRDGEAFALDNRCPHMGFPLSRGTVEDGMVVCHWHHARFDLRSGCTFDPFADDVPAYQTSIRGEGVFVRPVPVRDRRAYWLRRLHEGMALDVDLVVVKAIAALLALGVPARELAATAGLYGAENRDAFGPGLVSLTAMANLAPDLPGATAALALAQGVTRAAGDAAGQAPHRRRQPLDRPDLDAATAARWLRRWHAARHREGAERTLVTLLATGASLAVAGDALLGAVTDRIYADAGHAFDFTNKACELAELVGWAEGAPRVLPSAVPAFVGSRGAEESAAWQSPVDLVGLVRQAEGELAGALREGRTARWGGDPAALAGAIVQGEAAVVAAALLEALRAGAAPVQVAQAVAHAAVWRLAHFGQSNEFGDWDTALHTFTYSQAVRHAVARGEGPAGVLRGALHGALAVHQDRFLNVPPARLPTPAELATLPADGSELCARLLQAGSAQGQVEQAACLTARYLEVASDPGPLLATLVELVVREDAAFHTLQMCEASIRLWRQWEGAPPGRLALIALARYAAAHAPTQRAFAQTVSIAERLQRGEALHEEQAEG